MTNEAAYDAVADEYYDAQRHPTCRNFREASLYFVRKHLRKWAKSPHFSKTLVCEIGAGSSIVAEELLATGHRDLGNLILLDAVPMMLRYSSIYRSSGARLIVADAAALPLQAGIVGYFVISLGDPFNDIKTWQEIFRCLALGGECLFTTPSFEWATSYRTETTDERQNYALFQLRDGSNVHLPSLIYPPELQIRLFQEAGLAVSMRGGIPAGALKSPLSAKLNTAQNQPGGEVVTSYLLRKFRKDPYTDLC